MNNWIIQSKRSLAEVGFPRFVSVVGYNQALSALSNINSQHANSLVMKSSRLGPTWDQLEISARHSESLDLACAGAQLVSGTTEEYIGSWLDKNPELRSKAPTESI